MESFSYNVSFPFFPFHINIHLTPCLGTHNFKFTPEKNSTIYLISLSKVTGCPANQILIDLPVGFHILKLTKDESQLIFESSNSFPFGFHILSLYFVLTEITETATVRRVVVFDYSMRVYM